MKNQPTTIKSGALPRVLRATCIAGLLPALVLLFSIQSSQAGSATWNLNPTSGDWNKASNWTPSTVPHGSADTATFGVSNITQVSASVPYPFAVDSIVFNPGASAFTITKEPNDNALVISGAGITNNSGITQNFAVAVDAFGGYGGIIFSNNATAGSLTVITNYGAMEDGASIGGFTEFDDTSSAGNSTITSNGGAAGDYTGGGSTTFIGASTAANATLIANGGAVFGANGGTILFLGASSGGTARVEIFGNGRLEMFYHDLPGIAIGSIEGDGVLSLGANNLTVGSNNLSTTFSGQIFGYPGSFIKVGAGTLVLAGFGSSYTGGTTIKGGKLVVNNMIGSGTGTGAVQVNAGTLGGRGTIAGAVTVGTGSGAGAVLAPGRRGGKPGNPLTIKSKLTFNSDATYNCGLNTKGATADQVAANGVTINNAFFFFVVGGHRVLPPGTVFTVIRNTAATPIAGTFSNLVDGSTFATHGNTFQVSYEGGDDNDLTLTVQ